MLKREIKYEDFDGNEVIDTFYFNISKPELVELEVTYSQGFGAMLQQIIETKDNKALIAKFKEIVLMAYGEKSEDGKRFIKSDELKLRFSQTAAYISLFMELAMNDGAAATFIKGILPRDMAGEIDKAIAAELPKSTTPNV